LSKYRRIEINAYHRKVTVVSGEWRPGDQFETEPVHAEEGVSLDDSDACEPIEPDSPEGQLILVEAMRSLEQRLTPEARALISAGEGANAARCSTFKRFCSKLQSLLRPHELSLSISENPAVKQSVKDDSAQLDCR